MIEPHRVVEHHARGDTVRYVAARAQLMADAGYDVHMLEDPATDWQEID